MRYTATATVEIPAWKFDSFRAAVRRFARVEYFHQEVDYVSVIDDGSAVGLRRVRILIDSLGGEYEAESAVESAENAIARALKHVGAPLQVRAAASRAAE